MSASSSTSNSSSASSSSPLSSNNITTCLSSNTLHHQIQAAIDTAIDTSMPPTCYSTDDSLTTDGSLITSNSKPSSSSSLVMAKSSPQQSNSVASARRTVSKTAGSLSSFIEVPMGWTRHIEQNDRVVYTSPSGVSLRSHDEVRTYLLCEKTCKCGLQCPLNIYTVFNFTPSIGKSTAIAVSTLRPNSLIGYVYLFLLEMIIVKYPSKYKGIIK